MENLSTAGESGATLPDAAVSSLNTSREYPCGCSASGHGDMSKVIVKCHSRVERVTQSPMNPLRWSLDLACGHEAWITSKSRPKRKHQVCERCSAAATLKERSHSSAPHQEKP